ncbi:uncharacterized protein METZ01_LOCUS240487 [marine metagenome]|jgi:uncharacterized Zn finger protein (UPF0148 family)|uniref:Uncharacterized protein n=1 Tax=marine metagenome TaxID=408172 RepID=A0A382HLU1_9ZZZZ|tara:strand:+ start:930 stop:1277 length:348 start_codon:yes stop_codon:yes gene_type:complete
MLEGHFIDPADMYDRMNERDFVMVYCPTCQQRVEFPITHPNARGNYYQAVNIPVEIAKVMQWKKVDLFCSNCDLKLDIEKEFEQPQRVELKVRIDCSDMDKGTDSWYDEHGRGYD